MTGDERFDAALEDALELVGIVHGEGSQDDVTALLTRADMPALCIVLAALVPDDQAPTALLAWNDNASSNLREFRRLRRSGVSAHTAAALARDVDRKPAPAPVECVSDSVAVRRLVAGDLPWHDARMPDRLEAVKVLDAAGRSAAEQATLMRTDPRTIYRARARLRERAAS